MTLTADDRTTRNTELALRFLDLIDRHEFDAADAMMSDLLLLMQQIGAIPSSPAA